MYLRLCHQSVANGCCLNKRAEFRLLPVTLLKLTGHKCWLRSFIYRKTDSTFIWRPHVWGSNLWNEKRWERERESSFVHPCNVMWRASLSLTLCGPGLCTAGCHLSVLIYLWNMNNEQKKTTTPKVNFYISISVNWCFVAYICVVYQQTWITGAPAVISQLKQLLHLTCELLWC